MTHDHRFVTSTQNMDVTEAAGLEIDGTQLWRGNNLPVTELVRLLVRWISGAVTMAFVGPSDLAAHRNLVLYVLYIKKKTTRV